MTQQEQNNIATETERFMQGRYSFGILNLSGMQIISAESGTGRVSITPEIC